VWRPLRPSHGAALRALKCIRDDSVY